MFRLPISGLRFRVLLACFAAAVVSTPAVGQTPARLPSGRDLARHGLQLQWWGQAVMDPSRETVLHVNVDEDIVFVQASEGIITAFHAESGRKLWTQLLGDSVQISMPIATNEQEAYAALGLQMYGLNKFTGEILWELQLPHNPSTSPEADADHMYVGMVDGSVFCYDTNRIRELWEQGRLPTWSANAYRWRHKAAEEITSSPISDGRHVAFASRSGTVYSLTTRDRMLNFQFETDDPIRTQMGRGAGSLFVASDDTRMYCLNLETGVRRWTFTAGVPIRTQPQVIGNNVFVTPHDDGLYCLSVSTGGIKWHQRRATVFLAATDRYLFATDPLNNILLLSHDDGGIIGQLPLRGFSKLVPNERTDRLLLASPDGLVLCIREAGQEFPQYHKFPERRPILPELAEDDAAESPATE